MSSQNSNATSIVLNGLAYGLVAPSIAHAALMVGTLAVLAVDRGLGLVNSDHALTTTLAFLAVLLAAGLATLAYGVLPAFVTGCLLGYLRRLPAFAHKSTRAHALIAAVLLGALCLAVMPVFSTSLDASLRMVVAFAVAGLALEYLRSASDPEARETGSSA